MNKHDNDYYQPSMSRRDSLKWLSALAATAVLPGLTACATQRVTEVAGSATSAGHWPSLALQPVTALGYGKDPKLIIPPTSPWPRLLNQASLQQVARLCDLIVPAEGQFPSASAVNVPDVIDEWVSAPYARQQKDREIIMPLLVWLDDEAKIRKGVSFLALADSEQRAILDDIATLDETTDEAFVKPAEAFVTFRGLVLAGYFSSPQGTRDIGYKGNVAIAGDYPGPTDEAMAHINQVIAELGLADYAWQGD